MGSIYEGIPMASLTNLQDLRTILGRLNAEKPAGLGRREGETEHQERDGDFLKRLNLEIISRQGKARVLITGQIGVGKSSELRCFFRQRTIEKQKASFWVYCDLEREEHPERCGATGVFLAIFRDCWRASHKINEKFPIDSFLQREYQQLRDEILRRLTDWLKGELFQSSEKVLFKFGGMDFPVFLNDKSHALALILSKAAQHEAVSLPSERFGLVPDSLVNLLNNLLSWFKRVHNGRSPVLIVDHVDKIRDSSSAREVLSEAVPHWQRIEASIVITAPYEYTLGEMRHSVESYWGKPLMIYPLDIPDFGDDGIPSFYKDICKSSGLSALITDESLRWLAHYSGGIPRTFVLFLIESCKEAYMAGHKRVEISDAQMVIYNAERAYQDYGPIETSLLDQITNNQIGLNQAATLLRSPIGLLVCKPKEGEQPLRVHPLAEKMLERYRFKLEKKAV